MANVLQVGIECGKCGWAGSLDKADRGRMLTSRPACPMCWTTLQRGGRSKNLRLLNPKPAVVRKSWLARLFGRLSAGQTA